MIMNLDKVISKSFPTVGTLKDFTSNLAKEKYVLTKPKNAAKAVYLGKNGRVQILFQNGDGKQIILYISSKLIEKLKSGENIEISNSLVYVFESNKGKEFILGINVEVEIVDTSNYTKKDWDIFFTDFQEAIVNLGATRTECTRVRRNNAK